MASVEAFRWRECRVCKSEGRKGKPPHAEDCTCKPTSWRTRWRTPEGAPRSQNFDRKRDADAKKAEVETQRRNGDYVDSSAGRQLFEDYAREWAGVQEWKGSTRDRFPYFLNRIRPDIKGKRLNDFDRMTLERIKASLSKRYKRSVVEGDMHRICAILRHAHQNRRIPRDPTFGFDAAPKRRGDEPEGVSPDDVPTRDDVLALWRSAVAMWRAAIALGSAGLRIGEVLGMRRDSLALDAGKITVNAQAANRKGKGMVLTTTKNEKKRTIQVPQLVIVELRRHLREGFGGTWANPHADKDNGDEYVKGSEHEMLFLRPSGKLWCPQDFYRTAWWPTLEAAGFPPRRFKFHGLRHWCASTLLAEGVELPTVAGYIGDVQATVLRTYSHWLRDRHDLPPSVLDGAFGRTDPKPGDDTAVTHQTEARRVQA